MTRKLEKSIAIHALPIKVWDYITRPYLMKKWMGEPEMHIEVITDWIVGNSIRIRGFHHVNFENKGMVLQFDPYKVIQYSHLSSISRLPDTAENHSIITFRLTPYEEGSLLTVQVENFPTESIYKHLDFYWQGTITILKNMIEQH